jgi:GNAT superfamily N-acetyltransferase
MIRRATPADARTVAELLFEFNTEFEDPTPPVDTLVPRARRALGLHDVAVFLAGDPAVGIAVTSCRPTPWAEGPVVTLDELFVQPGRRYQGLGRKLLREVIALARERDAAWLELGTGEGDAAARALYESEGFVNVEPGDPGRLLFYYLGIDPELNP